MDDVEPWIEKNKYIYDGYLKPGVNFIMIFFSWHNQTMNIYTQIIPFIIFWMISIYQYTYGGLRYLFHIYCWL